VIVAHVAVTTVSDYLARRAAYRQAHIERLVALRERGVVIAGGPAPDGRSADIFYRVRQAADLAPLVEEDPYHRGGVWTTYTSRSFSQFVEPWEAPPVVIDGSRCVTIVEGATADPDTAQLALVELRGAGRLVFGGLFDEKETLAVLRSSDAAEAVAWLADTGFWSAPHLTARPLLHVL
jgi:uncharacterized protein YciI